MLEFPEAINTALQLNQHIHGKRVEHVLPPTKPHKFCWFAGEPEAYDEALKGAEVCSAEGFGGYVELFFNSGKRLCFNDGVNVLLTDKCNVPQNYQLLIEFDDAAAMVFTVAMYGGIVLHDGCYDNLYYLKSKSAISPFDDKFETYYRNLFEFSKATLSVKAFLATEQRFPGIGNGVLQDILLEAGIHPKRKIGTLTGIEQDRLLSGIVSVLKSMTDKGGRDTEKNIFGQFGGYKTRLSKNTLNSGCVLCGGIIIKENYLGGTIYYCPSCQRKPEK